MASQAEAQPQASPDLISFSDELMRTLRCPITMLRMENPVIDPDGHSYESWAILEHLKKNQTSPLTRQPLSENQLSPNIELQKLISKINDDAAAAESDPPTKTFSEWVTKDDIKFQLSEVFKNRVQMRPDIGSYFICFDKKREERIPDFTVKCKDVAEVDRMRDILNEKGIMIEEMEPYESSWIDWDIFYHLYKDKNLTEVFDVLYYTEVTNTMELIGKNDIHIHLVVKYSEYQTKKRTFNEAKKWIIGKGVRAEKSNPNRGATNYVE